MDSKFEIENPCLLQAGEIRNHWIVIFVKTNKMKKQKINYSLKNGKPVKTVDEYLSNVPPKERAVLQKLRKAIKGTAPKAEEVISYQIPGYKYYGALVFFAAFENHLSLYAVGKRLLVELAEELKPFEVKGTTVHFTAAKPLPLTLVKRIVKMRMKENEVRVRKKLAK